jgi:nitrogenase molybdenum-iron protein alpha/beta subunit
MGQNKTELNRLSQINSNAGIRFSHNAASPGSHCPMHTALATLKNIEGISSLVVGMPECGYYSRYVMDEPIGKNGELHYVYILDSSEVVFGCSDGLREALLLMEEEGAEAIAVIMTCIPALIGEDIKGILDDLNSERQTKAVCIDMAHFKRNGYESGIYEAYGSLLTFVTKKIIASERRVNIFGSLESLEGRELKEILQNNDYEIIYFSKNLSLELLNSTITSKLSIVMEIHMLPLAIKLKEEFNVPYIFLGRNYGEEAVTYLYKKIFTALDIKEVSCEFSSRKKLQTLLKVKTKKMSGISFSVSCVLPDVLGVVSFLCTLEMKPVLLHLEEYNELMEGWKTEILEKEQDPYVTYVVRGEGIPGLFSGREEDDLIIKTSLSLGNLMQFNNCAVVNDKELRSLSTLFGYERSYRLMELITNCLEVKENAFI